MFRSGIIPSWTTVNSGPTTLSNSRSFFVPGDSRLRAQPTIDIFSSHPPPLLSTTFHPPTATSSTSPSTLLPCPYLPLPLTPPAPSSFVRAPSSRDDPNETASRRVRLLLSTRWPATGRWSQERTSHRMLPRCSLWQTSSERVRGRERQGEEGVDAAPFRRWIS